MKTWTGCQKPLKQSRERNGCRLDFLAHGSIIYRRRWRFLFAFTLRCFEFTQTTTQVWKQRFGSFGRIYGWGGEAGPTFFFDCFGFFSLLISCHLFLFLFLFPPLSLSLLWLERAWKNLLMQQTGGKGKTVSCIWVGVSKG